MLNRPSQELGRARGQLSAAAPPAPRSGDAAPGDDLAPHSGIPAAFLFFYQLLRIQGSELRRLRIRGFRVWAPTQQNMPAQMRFPGSKTRQWSQISRKLYATRVTPADRVSALLELYARRLWALPLKDMGSLCLLTELFDFVAAK